MTPFSVENKRMECVPGRVGTRPSSTTETLLHSQPEVTARNSTALLLPAAVDEDRRHWRLQPPTAGRIFQWPSLRLPSQGGSHKTPLRLMMKRMRNSRTWMWRSRISQRWNEERRIPRCRFVAIQATALTLARKTQLWERAHAGSGTSA